MVIVVDEAIPYWREAFTPFGEVRPYPGRKLRPADVREADALVVRSVTQVNASLLEGSSVQFLGSATIGMDHIDVDYLKTRGIRFTNAAGCNANAVSEYVVAALMFVAERKGWNLRGKSIAIIGVGNVGSRVHEKARALGMRVLLCDPPLRDATGDPNYLSSLSDVLSADILTFHVPLTVDGPYPTHHLVNQRVLDCLSPHQVVINSSRGPVIAERDLRFSLEAGGILAAVLDVWEGEPTIDPLLLDLVELGTPHIAGYSINGKIRATEMMFEELCRHFRQSLRWDTRHLYPAAVKISPEAGKQGEDALRSIVHQAYDILRDDGALRAVRSLPDDRVRSEFDRLRNQYRFRPEFRHFIVNLPNDDGLIDVVGALGFQTAIAEGE